MSQMSQNVTLFKKSFFETSADIGIDHLSAGIYGISDLTFYCLKKVV